MPGDEERDQLRGSAEAARKQHDAGDQEQVVPTEQHVLDPERDEFQRRLVARGAADAVRDRPPGSRQKADGDRQGDTHKAVHDSAVSCPAGRAP